MDKKSMMRISIVFLIFTVFWGVVFGAYTIWSNQVSVTVTTPAQLDLTVNGGGTSTTILLGQTLILTAHLSDNTNGVEVYFYDVPGNALFGHNTTQGGGYATWSQIMGSAGSFNYNATCTHP